MSSITWPSSLRSNSSCILFRATFRAFSWVSVSSRITQGIVERFQSPSSYISLIAMRRLCPPTITRLPSSSASQPFFSSRLLAITGSEKPNSATLAFTSSMTWRVILRGLYSAGSMSSNGTSSISISVATSDFFFLLTFFFRFLLFFAVFFINLLLFVIDYNFCYIFQIYFHSDGSCLYSKYTSFHYTEKFSSIVW